MKYLVFVGKSWKLDDSSFTHTCRKITHSLESCQSAVKLLQHYEPYWRWVVCNVVQPLLIYVARLSKHQITNHIIIQNGQVFLRCISKHCHFDPLSFLAHSEGSYPSYPTLSLVPPPWFTIAVLHTHVKHNTPPLSLWGYCHALHRLMVLQWVFSLLTLISFPLFWPTLNKDIELKLLDFS